MSIHTFLTCKLLFSACQREWSFLKISWKFGIVLLVSPENRVARGTFLLSHSPALMAELLPKWGCQGMKEHSSTKGAREEVDSTPKFQRKFCKFQNFPLEKIKTKIFARSHLCIWVSTQSSWRTIQPRKVVLVLRKLLFRVEVYQKAASIPEICPPFLFLPHLRCSLLWKSQPFLQKYMKYSLKLSSEIKFNIYCRFDHMNILLLFSEGNTELS